VSRAGLVGLRANIARARSLAFGLGGALWAPVEPALALPTPQASPPTVTELRVAPATANPRITGWTADHFVWSAGNGSQIMLLLPGSNGRPANFRLIGRIAAQQGYRAIGLMYPDEVAVLGACARDRSRDCMANVRAEIIQGSDRSPHVTVGRDDSIDGRLADLLRVLIREQPGAGWEDFLTADSAPRWDRIAVGGLSQGGGHAAYIAKLRAVPRVVMFGAPADGRGGDVAPWMSIGATPRERYYGFRHERDPFRSISANWKALGLEKLGGVKTVDANTTDFGGAHLFVTDLLPESRSYEQAHGSVFGGATPRRPDGGPVFEAVWRYLFGSP
jgi:hypothetical protein